MTEFDQLLSSEMPAVNIPFAETLFGSEGEERSGTRENGISFYSELYRSTWPGQKGHTEHLPGLHTQQAWWRSTWSLLHFHTAKPRWVTSALSHKHKDFEYFPLDNLLLTLMTHFCYCNQQRSITFIPHSLKVIVVASRIKDMLPFVHFQNSLGFLWELDLHHQALSKTKSKAL